MIRLFAIFCLLFGRAFAADFTLQDFPDVPEKPLRHLIHFFDSRVGHTATLKYSKSESRREVIKAHRYAIIIDYSQPADEKRLYLLDLKKKESSVHYVTHGFASGILFAESFSNQPGSSKTSLGFYLGHKTYEGRFGYSLKLFGLDSTNDNAYARAIVMHGADYASADFIQHHGRVGFSQGCPAVDPAMARELIDKMKGGGIIYAYHPELEN